MWSEYPVLISSYLMVAAMELKHLSANHWKFSDESGRCLVKSLVFHPEPGHCPMERMRSFSSLANALKVSFLTVT